MKIRKFWQPIIALVLLTASCGNDEVLGLFKNRGIPLPTVSILNPVDNLLMNSNTLLVYGTAADRSDSGLYAVYFSYDSNAFVPLQGTTNWSTNLTAISFGTHSIRVYAMDNASNYSSTNSVSFTYSIDPILTVSSPTNTQIISNATVSVNGSATDQSGSGLEGIYISLDGGAFTPASGTSSWSSNFAFPTSGTRTIRVYAMDNAGNYSPTNSITFSIEVDPFLTVSSHSHNQTITSSSFTLSGSAIDNSSTGLSSVLISVDGGAFQNASGTTSWSSNFTITTSGSRNFRVYTIDTAGNSSQTNSLDIIIDVNPEITITSHSDSQTVYSNEFALTGTATDNSSTGLDGVFLSLDGGPFSRVSGTANWSTNLSGLADMTHTIRVYAQDLSGNISTTNQITITTVQDTTPPTVAVSSHNNNDSVTSMPFTLSGTAADAGTGVDSVYLSIDGGSFSAVSGTTSWSSNISSLSNGTHTFRVYAMDVVSNYSTTNEITLEIADYGPYAGLYTIIVANGSNLRISTNGYTSFTSISAGSRKIIGCSVDRYRNIYVSASNTSTFQGNFGSVRNFSGSIDWSSYNSGNASGICASDDYGNFYTYETSGSSDGIIYSDDFCTNYSWVDNTTILQSGVGVCYVVANRSGYVVLGRNNGTLSVRDGGNGTFTTVTTAGNTYGPHQMALTTNASPTITFIEYGQFLRSSDDSYTRYDLGADVHALTYHGQRLWIGFTSGNVRYSDDHGQTLSSTFNIGVTENVTALAVDSSGRIFAGTDQGKLYMSDNNGSSFTERENWSGDAITQIYIEDW